MNVNLHLNLTRVLHLKVGKAAGALRNFTGESLNVGVWLHLARTAVW